MSWQERGLCAGDTSGIWFARADSQDGRHAALICAACPVKTECIEDAIQWTSAEIVGIRGGLGSAGISKLRRERGIVARVPAEGVRDAITALIDRGLTKREIARRSGISVNTVKDIARGKGKTTHVDTERRILAVTP